MCQVLVLASRGTACCCRLPCAALMLPHENPRLAHCRIRGNVEQSPAVPAKALLAQPPTPKDMRGPSPDLLSSAEVPGIDSNSNAILLHSCS